MEKTFKVYSILPEGVTKDFKSFKGDYRIVYNRDVSTGIISIIDTHGEIVFAGSSNTFCIALEKDIK